MQISKFDYYDFSDTSVSRLCADKRYISDDEYKKLLTYLTRRDFVDAASSARVYDVFEKADSEKYCRVVYTDGTYEWSSEEIFYFEKYNLILDNDFIQYVLSKSN